MESGYQQYALVEHLLHTAPTHTCWGLVVFALTSRALTRTPVLRLGTSHPPLYKAGSESLSPVSTAHWQSWNTTNTKAHFLPLSPKSTHHEEGRKYFLV